MNKGEIKVLFGSDFDYIDLVQEISDNITRMVGFNEECRYWIGMSVRESVTNAIQHGNKQNQKKKVGVRFKFDPKRIVIFVQDEGQGFAESNVPDPLAPENLLKPSGRGIFYVRSFMDDVRFSRLPEGGTEVRMEKRLNHKSKEIQK